MLPKNKMVMAALEKLYDCTAVIYEFEEKIDKNSFIRTVERVLKYSNIKCRISFDNSVNGQNIEPILSADQKITLFLSPKTIIKPGSEIIVSGRGRIWEFNCSGQPSVYDSHQEVPLTIKEDKS